MSSDDPGKGTFYVLPRFISEKRLNLAPNDGKVQCIEGVHADYGPYILTVPPVKKEKLKEPRMFRL